MPSPSTSPDTSIASSASRRLWPPTCPAWSSPVPHTVASASRRAWHRPGGRQGRCRQGGGDRLPVPRPAHVGDDGAPAVAPPAAVLCLRREVGRRAGGELHPRRRPPPREPQPPRHHTPLSGVG